MEEEKMTTKRTSSISVIVPVYKVEPYLRCCIDSILAQTFTDFELILVDDGSPDNCGEICDEYAAKDDRVVVIHQENGGLSAARNAGIDWVFANSESQWITFVDSDDSILPTFLEIMYGAAKNTGADISACMAIHFTNQAQLEDANDIVHYAAEMEGKEACKRRYLEPELCLSYPHGKLYRRELFAKMRFPVGKIYEDEAIVPILLYCAEKVVFLRARLYCYLQRNGSISSGALLRRMTHHVDAFNNCLAFYTFRREKEIAEVAQYYRDTVWANYVLKMWRKRQLTTIPDQYKMPLWKAWYITIRDTLRRGGLKFVFIRLGNLIRKFIKK